MSAQIPSGEAKAAAPGQAWVWAVDAFGLALATSLVAAAADASALTDVVAGLVLAIPLAVFAATLAAEGDEPQQPERPKAPAVRTIVITPRPNDARGAP